MDLGLCDRVAVVAGSSAGIGYACAEELSREGARVVICGRDAGRLRDAAARLRRTADIGEERVLAVVADVSKAEDVQRLAERAHATYGTVHVLVTNAGGPAPGNFADLRDEDFEAGFQQNLMSAIRLTRAFMPRMIEQSWGRIVHLTSVAVKQPLDRLTVSNTVRSAFLGLTRSLASELAPYNVLVHNVCPGYTRTERLNDLADDLARQRGLTPQAVRAGWEAAIPAGRLAEPREIAALVAFLCSERASYMTGTTIAADGGFARGIV
jgi:3-oxoacyl-[acyl-carrier protein] reductase